MQYIYTEYYKYIITLVVSKNIKCECLLILTLSQIYCVLATRYSGDVEW